jgi:probable F420-dependent oxidoreductase
MSVGIWTFAFEDNKIGAVRDAAREVEALGFDTLWFGEAFGREAYTHAGVLLAATERLRVATGIASISRREPLAAAGAERLLDQAYPGRFRHGIGGHRVGASPLSAMRDYLSAMDRALPDSALPEPGPRRLIAAVGPKMLELSREIADGAHPYFVPVEHTAGAREILGPEAYLAVEQAVVLEAHGAQDLARDHVAFYVKQAPHHQANLRRLGFTEDDLATVSDRLVDALVAFRGEQSIADRVQAHLDAGADHVCLQVITDHQRIPLAEWRTLADITL